MFEQKMSNTFDCDERMVHGYIAVGPYYLNGTTGYDCMESILDQGAESHRFHGLYQSMLDAKCSFVSLVDRDYVRTW
jgi:hypothetical protein